MESRRIQDMLLTIHNSMSNKALINLRSVKYNLRRQEYVLLYLKLTLLNMDSSHGDILQLKNGTNYQMTSE